MTFTFFSIVAPAGFFLGSLILQEVGRRLGARHVAHTPQGSSGGLGAIEGAVFALMGLPLAFTLSGALQRFDFRRQLIVDEANAIRTAYQRIDLLPAAAQPALKDKFRQYLSARLDLYREAPDFSHLTEEFSHDRLARINSLGVEIWREAVAACSSHSLPAACTLLLPAINTMYDVCQSRVTIGQRHPPNAIFIMLFAIGLASSLLAGFGMGGGRVRSWLHIVGFSASVAVALYVITNLEFPRLGLVRIDDFDRVLKDVLAGMT